MDKNNQDQRSGDNSTNVQVAGDIMIGVTYSEVRQIAEDLFKTNFLMLQGEARNIAQQRAEEIVKAFLAALQSEKAIAPDVARDPDLQHALFTAQRDYARSGKNDLKMLLVDILVERAKIKDDELKKIVLNEAIQVAPKLTLKQLNAISIRFLIAESRDLSVINIESFQAYLKSTLIPFCKELAKERSDYKHIEYAGCGTVGFVSNDFYTYLKGNYSGVLSTGFDETSITPLALSPLQRDKLIIPCLRDKSKFQIAAINEEAINIAAQELNLNQNQNHSIKELHNKHLFSKEEMEKLLISLDAKFSELIQTWNNSGLSRLELTTIGIALAHANIKKTIGVDHELGVWIK